MNYDNTSTPSTTTRKSKLTRLQRLFKIFHNKTSSRRMAATALGYPDQTYMVTKQVLDLLRNGTAQKTKIKCERSGRLVEGITTNPEQFKTKKNFQYNLFNNEGLQQ